MEQFWMFQGGALQGPYDVAGLMHLPHFRYDTVVCRTGESAWIPAHEIDALRQALLAADPALESVLKTSRRVRIRALERHLPAVNPHEVYALPRRTVPAPANKRTASARVSQKPAVGWVAGTRHSWPLWFGLAGVVFLLFRTEPLYSPKGMPHRTIPALTHKTIGARHPAARKQKTKRQLRHPRRAAPVYRK